MARELGELQGVLKQLETYLGTWSQVGDAIAELLAQRAMVEQMPNAQKQMLKVNGDLDRLESQRRTIEGVMCRQTGRLSAEGVRDLYTDLASQLQVVFEQRATLARVQVLVTIQERLELFAAEPTEGELTQAQAQQKLTMLTAQLDLALQLVEELAPRLSTTTIQVIR